MTGLGGISRPSLYKRKDVGGTMAMEGRCWLVMAGPMGQGAFQANNNADILCGGCLCIRVTMGQAGTLKLMDISLETAGPVWWVFSSLVLFVSERSLKGEVQPEQGLDVIFLEAPL